MSKKKNIIQPIIQGMIQDIIMHSLSTYQTYAHVYISHPLRSEPPPR